MRLGRTKVNVTRLGFGTAPLGGLYAPVTDEAALRTIDAAWQAGVRFFDTAPLYGHGLAETRLGEALASRPRDSFVLATKVGRLLRPVTDRSVESAHYKGAPPVEPHFDFSYEGVMTSVEESLARLEARSGRHPPHSRSGRSLRRSPFWCISRARAVAAGGCRRRDRRRDEPVADAAAIRRRRRTSTVSCWRAGTRSSTGRRTESFLPLCALKSITVIAGGVYNSGILADPRAGAKFNYDDASAELVAQALRLESVCKAHGVPLKAAAIQFPFTHRRSAAVLTGARSEAEFIENLAMLQTPIAPALWNALRDTH